jgi:hypothetical protein
MVTYPYSTHLPIQRVCCTSSPPAMMSKQCAGRKYGGRNAFDHWTWHHTERKAIKKNCTCTSAWYVAIFSIKICFFSFILLCYFSRCLLGSVCMSKAQKGSMVRKVWETLLYIVFLYVYISLLMVFLSTPVPTLRYMDAVVVCIQSGVLTSGTPCNLVDRY